MQQFETTTGMLRTMMDWYPDDPDKEEYGPVADAAGLPVDALLFVFDALRVAPYYFGEEPGDAGAEVRDCSATELCRALPRYARHLFGTEWQAALKDMKIFTSEDLGKIVFTMVSAGLLEARAEDRQENFEGVCQFIN